MQLNSDCLAQPAADTGILLNFAEDVSISIMFPRKPPRIGSLRLKEAISIYHYNSTVFVFL